MQDHGPTPIAPATFWANAIRRNALLVLAFGLIGGLLGIGFAAVTNSGYTATAAVLIDPVQGNPYEPEGQADPVVALETEATLVATDPVAQLTAKRLDDRMSPTELRQEVTVEVPTNTQVLEISVTAPDRELARDAAQAFAESYLEYRKGRGEALIDAQVQEVEQQKAGTQSELTEATTELGTEGLSASRRSYLEERVNTLAARLASLETEESTLTAADLQPGQVITPAEEPPSTVLLTLVLFAGAGAIAMLMLGAAIAIGRDRLDDRMSETTHLERLGLSVFGVVDDRYGMTSTGARGHGLAPDLPEPYREVRTAVVTALDAPPVGFTVLAAEPGISAAAESAALAVGLARAGFTVALVDTLGEPTRTLADRDRLPGLTELLTEDADLQSLLIQPEDRLNVLPPGTGGKRAMDLLLSHGMRHALADLSEWNDYVIIAGGSASGADGQALASLSGAVVLVVAKGHTERDQVTHSLDVLERVDASCIGAVLVEGYTSARGGFFRRLFGRSGSGSGATGSGGSAPGNSRSRPAGALGNVPRRPVPSRSGTPTDGSSTGSITGPSTGSGAGRRRSTTATPWASRPADPS